MKYLTTQWKVALGRGDVGTSEDIGYKTTTQLGCGFMSMIRVAPAGILRCDGTSDAMGKEGSARYL